MKLDDARQKYNQLFKDEKTKADAFDKIAEKYYYSNFGSTSKTDFDVLMFSIYIERILDESESDFSQYSDYTLSKQLGITQTKVSSLKEKKELLYPYDRFKWQDSLLRISDSAVYETGKIKLMIPDKNLYIEVKNAIETAGGYVEAQLTSNLLQVRLEYFLDLIIAISESESRESLRSDIKKKMNEKLKDIEIVERDSFGKVLIGKTPDLIIDIIGVCLPCFGNQAANIAKTIYNIIKQNFTNKKGSAE